MQRPSRLSAAPSGALFILDRGNNEIRKYSPEGALVARAGGYGWGTDEAFDTPNDVNAVNDLQILVADYGNHRIAEFDARLTRTAVIDGDLHQTGQRIFGYPRSAAIDRFGAFYVVDDENKRVLKVDRSRAAEQAIGGIDAGKGRLRDPGRIRIGNNDRVYVQDGLRLMVYDLFGNYLQSVILADSGTPAFAVGNGDELYVLSGKKLRKMAGAADTSILLVVHQEPLDLAIAGEKLVFLFPDAVGFLSVKVFRREADGEN